MFVNARSLISLRSSVTIETWLGSMYSTYFPAKLSVDLRHDISSLSFNTF